MGKPTGFIEIERETSHSSTPKSRIKHFNEFHTPLPKERQEAQGARCMECGVPFCQSGINIGGATTGCPLKNLIPEWNDLIFNKNWEEAYKRLRKTSNFPEFTARVCPAPCEAGCTCGLNGDSVSIKENEFGIIENAFENGYVVAQPPKVRTGKKIAIIGSGPAGLVAADQLNRRGHSVTVFERDDRIGGLLMYGIPNMKLEKHIIDRRINLLKEEGIEFKINSDIGNNIKASDILKHYDRVVLACGASNPRDIKVPGRESNGIYFAVDYLKSVTKSLLNSNLERNDYISPKGKKVMVIGGGDTGNDCVGTSIRLGAVSVIQLEMMPKLPDKRIDSNPWPQWPKVCKVDYGQEESIAVFGKDPRVYQTTVKEFVADKKGNLMKAILIELESKVDEKSGRMIMAPIEGSEYEIEVDIVFIAAGFLGSESYVTKAFGVDLNDKYHTNVPKIFVAGDMRRGQSLVVWAIREGREVARAVDEDLMGYSNL